MDVMAYPYLSILIQCMHKIYHTKYAHNYALFRTGYSFDGLLQDWNISSALTMEILYSCTKSSIRLLLDSYNIFIHATDGFHNIVPIVWWLRQHQWSNPEVYWGKIWLKIYCNEKQENTNRECISSDAINETVAVFFDAVWICFLKMHRGIITVASQWVRWRLKSPASRLFTQPFTQAQMKEGNSPVTLEFPAQMARDAENVSISWRYHDRNSVWNLINTRLICIT